MLFRSRAYEDLQRQAAAEAEEHEDMLASEDGGSKRKRSSDKKEDKEDKKKKKAKLAKGRVSHSAFCHSPPRPRAKARSDRPRAGPRLSGTNEANVVACR